MFVVSRYDSATGIVEGLGRLDKRFARARRFNLVSMLQTVRERMFTEDNGDRRDVPNGLIIVTDTTSTDNRRSVQTQLAQMAQVRSLC